ncbi:MAG: nucleoside phosphorylase [Edaphobacter sp.]|uniref:phosphorylase family protein n=1 Tax=Edaphobacter sp. TaxID=1934404 RepID=UPI0023992A0E|nr:nucleoside phosphorylase [Edaphobacter sp.]MDE1175376.1 nucleoside phosphorylase [Edaphobacter sp.]
MRIGIIAALPGELQPLVRGWERQHGTTRGVSVWTKNSGDDHLIAVCGGMGSAAAMRSFTAAEFFGSLDLVLSIGWAGALDSGMRTGECYVPSEIIDVQTGERFALCSGKRALRLVTTPIVADAKEKRRLWQSYNAVLVDMEAATIARLAAMRGIPLGCFKGVSDGANAMLPDLNPFIDDQGQMRMAAFLAHVAVRPHFWASLAHLGKNSRRAAEALATKVHKFLEQKDIERTNRTGAV